MEKMERCKSVFEPRKNAHPNFLDHNLILDKKSDNGTFGIGKELKRNRIRNKDRSKGIKQSET